MLLLPAMLHATRHHTENQLLKQAQAAEDRKDWEVALDLYQKALVVEPNNMPGQIGLQRVRIEAGNVRLQKGRALRQQGQLDAALAELQKGVTDDPSSGVLVQEIKVTLQMIQDAKNGPAKPPEERGLTPVEIERQKMDDRLRSIEGIPELKPIQRQISTLKINNQPPRVLYETVGKLAGINVIIDPQFQPTIKNANLDLSNTNLEDALDYIGLITHTFWKPITSNAIFVADDNPTKRRDYGNVAVKTFYLQNPTTPQDLTEIITALRSVTDCRRLYQAAAINAVVARCSVDELGLVEKLIHDLDKAKSEVLVDVLVLDVNTTHVRDLQATIQAGSGTGLTVPITYTPTTTAASTGTTGTTTGTTTSTSSLTHISINQFSATLPNALLNAVLSDSDTRVLQSPQLRAVDGGKATLNIGSKIPFASGSTQSAIAGVGVSGLVQNTFQYADVGVNITLQPYIHGTNEVSMHLEVDVSSVVSEQNFGGSTGVNEPVIGQKKSTTDIRVRDGEVTLLGGLLNTNDIDSSGGIPGLVNIPILGKFFFGNSHKERDKEELLIAVIPHIVRSESVDELNLRDVAAGTDSLIQIRHSHPEEAPPPAPAPTTGTATTSGTAPTPSTEPVPVTTAAVTQPTSPVSTAPVMSLPGATPPGIMQELTHPRPVGTAPRVKFTPDTVEARVGNPVVPTLTIENAVDVFSVALRVRWDPKVLRLNSIAPGQFLSADGQKVNSPVDIRNDAGEATINLTRLPGAAGAGGNGPLATFAFTAMSPGATNISVTEITPKNSKQEPIEMTAPAIPVVVK
jgi:general secretion pathway protein D